MSPLGFLVGLVPGPGWLGPLAAAGEMIASGELIGRLRGQSSRYRAAMPTQVGHAEARGLRDTLAPLAGSEDWIDQLAAGARSEGASLPAVTSPQGRSRVPWYPSMFTPHLPAGLVEGRGTGYITGAYNKGWVNVSQPGTPAWGGSAGLAAARPNTQRATLLEPTDKTPSPRAVVSAYDEANAGRARLMDKFGD